MILHLVIQGGELGDRVYGRLALFMTWGTWEWDVGRFFEIVSFTQLKGPPTQAPLNP